MRLRDAFAYPFKVLRDLFNDPPFASDPEFTPFNLNALRSEASEGSRTAQPRLARPKREKIAMSALLLVLVAIVIALIIMG
jgi:hypothetical protein